MAIRTADAEWQGNLRDGQGKMRLGSGAFEGTYSFRSRMGDGAMGTNPEELIGAAHAGCFSMALSAALAGAGFTPPVSIQRLASISIPPRVVLRSVPSISKRKPSSPASMTPLSSGSQRTQRLIAPCLKRLQQHLLT